jgi:hypothetical protein
LLGCALGNHDAPPSLTELAGLKNFKALDLADSQVTGVKELAGLKCLRTLDMGLTKLSDEALVVVAFMLALWPPRFMNPQRHDDRRRAAASQANWPQSTSGRVSFQSKSELR